MYTLDEHQYMHMLDGRQNCDKICTHTHTHQTNTRIGHICTSKSGAYLNLQQKKILAVLKYTKYINS